MAISNGDARSGPAGDKAQTIAKLLCVSVRAREVNSQFEVEVVPFRDFATFGALTYRTCDIHSRSGRGPYTVFSLEGRRCPTGG
jgi:hypothetical protein